jgi:hypothetical protein
MPSNKKQRAKLQTADWLKHFVIKYAICPFAQTVVTQKSLHYAVDSASNIEDCLYQLMVECQRLDNGDNIETTLVIYDNYFDSFDDFWIISPWPMRY